MRCAKYPSDFPQPCSSSASALAMKWFIRRPEHTAHKPQPPSPVPGPCPAVASVKKRPSASKRTMPNLPGATRESSGTDGPRKARCTPSVESLAGLALVVGPVTELREVHLARHGGGSGLRSCPRCRWYLHGHRWTSAYGVGAGSALGGPGVGPRQRVQWISERPARWGGSWSLGCVFCADAAARAKLDGVDKTCAATPRRAGSRWARYDVCPATLQAEHIKQHSHNEWHKVAERAFYRPDMPLRLPL